MKRILALVFVVITGACILPETKPDASVTRSTETISEAVNINTADEATLRRIPNIGERLARDIVAHREKHGPFRKVEHLLLLTGISDTRFRDIRHLIRID